MDKLEQYDNHSCGMGWGGSVMNRYIGTKVIKAKPITLGDYNKLRGWKMPPNEDPQEQGYLVEYTDGGKPNHPDYEGYISWSPKAQFYAAYRRTEHMSFGLALEALKKGKRVARRGWNGKGMFIFLLPGNCVSMEVVSDPNLRSVLQQELGEDATHFDALPSIRMFTADKKILTGWLASQTDMLSDDWEIVGTV